MKHFVDDVEQRAGRQRQEQDIDVGGGEEVADHGAKEGRSAADQAGDQEKAPRGHRAVGRQRRGDAEALGDVVESEADYEHDREGDRPGGGGLADRQPLR